MKFAIVSGSARHQSESFKIASYIDAELQSLTQQTYLLNLADNPLPLWDESIYAQADKWVSIWGPISTALQSADALVLVVPEWHGAVPAAVRNFIQLTSAVDLGHKPALIVTVSGSQNGVYPVCELRMSAYKNNRICYIPENLIIRNVSKNFNAGAPVDEEDTYLRSRCTYALGILAAYAQALIAVRKSGAVNHSAFPNGM